jgi:hypothetical protein
MGKGWQILACFRVKPVVLIILAAAGIIPARAEIIPASAPGVWALALIIKALKQFA